MTLGRLMSSSFVNLFFIFLTYIINITVGSKVKYPHILWSINKNIYLKFITWNMDSSSFVNNPDAPSDPEVPLYFNR